MSASLAQRASYPRARLRHLLITDSVDAAARSADIVVWLGRGEVPTPLARRRCVVAPAALRAAAVYVAAAHSKFNLALANPLAFMIELAEVRDAPGLRAA